MQARQVGERLLRPAPLGAELPDPGPEAFADVVVSHRGESMMVPPSARQPINRQTITSIPPAPIVSSSGHEFTHLSGDALSLNEDGAAADTGGWPPGYVGLQRRRRGTTMGTSATEVERLIQAARLHLAQGELHEAAGRATEAIRLDGKQPAAYLVRAEAHRRLKRPERALADLAVAIRLDPQQPGPYVIRAEILKRRNLFDQAIADATYALMLDPRNAAAYPDPGGMPQRHRRPGGGQGGRAGDAPDRPHPTGPRPRTVGEGTVVVGNGGRRRAVPEAGGGQAETTNGRCSPTASRWTGPTGHARPSATRRPPKSWGLPAATSRRPPRGRSRGCGTGLQYFSPLRNGLPLILGTATIVAVAVWLALRSDRGRSRPGCLPPASRRRPPVRSPRSPPPPRRRTR